MTIFTAALRRVTDKSRLAAALSAAVLFLTVMPMAASSAGTRDAAQTDPVFRYWSACAPIVVEIVPSEANPLYEEEAVLAVRDIADRMGLTVIIKEGNVVPTPEWVGAAPTSGEGDRVLRIAVADHGPLLTRGLNGEARSQLTGEGEIVRASVVLSQDALGWMVGGSGVTNPGSRLRLLVMHEVGHAFGIRHSDSLSDVMSTPAISYVGPADAWGPGDLDEISKRREASTCR